MRTVFLLIRAKRGASPASRLDSLLSSQLFDTVKAQVNSFSPPFDVVVVFLVASLVVVVVLFFLFNGSTHSLLSSQLFDTVKAQV